MDMKLGPITKLNKKNNVMSNEFNGYIMLENCDVIDIFPIYIQFGTVCKPGSECIVFKTYI